VVVASITDLSEDLAMQAELARQKDLTFQSEKMSALGELLAGVAHELNNPLSIVVGNAMILAEEVPSGPVAARSEKIGQAAERCVRIVRAFLAMAREQPLQIAPVDICGLIRTATEAYMASAPPNEVTLVVDLAPDLPRVMVDEAQMVQVLVNLLTNAHHAIAGSGRSGTIRIQAEPRPWSGKMAVVIDDDGPGVPRDIRSRIFDPLFTTKSSSRGTGMGLALCQRIVLSHGGSIRLLDRPRDGATFEIELRMETPS